MEEERAPLTLEQMEKLADEFRDAIEYAEPQDIPDVRGTFLENRGLTADEHKAVWDMAMRPRG